MAAWLVEERELIAQSVEERTDCIVSRGENWLHSQ